MSRNVCKWCGSGPKGDYGHVFSCESWQSVAGAVVQSHLCQQRCLDLRLQHEETIEILKAREANTVEALRGHIEDLQRRIADAVAALETITRHEIEADFEFDLISERNEHGNWVQWDDVETILEILAGKDSHEQESEQ